MRLKKRRKEIPRWDSQPVSLLPQSLRVKQKCQDKFSVPRLTPIITPSYPVYPSCAQRVTVTYCGPALSTLEVLGRGGLLNQSRPLTQGLEQGQHLPWCEGGAAQPERGGCIWGVLSPQSAFIPAFLTDHSHLGRGAAGVCAERGGPQPGLETLAGGRDVVSGEQGEGWERGLGLTCTPPAQVE